VIWLTWRQQRTETLIAALLVALVAALLVPTGLHMASVYDHDGIGACLTDPSISCRERLNSFTERWDALLNLVGWLNLVPGLIGVLLAAPFVLEFERGTFRLSWTQSITRGRWLAVRIALIVGASVAVSVLLTLLMTWWRGPLDDVNGRFSDGFDLEGLVPSAYTLFAAALVIAIGVVLRRTAAAIGLAFVAFIAVRIGILTWARPNYQAPIRETWVGDPSGIDLRQAWVFTQGGELRAADGQPPDPAVLSTCITDASTKRLDDACLDRYGIVQSTFATYQPESRFWLFQAIEAGIFVALALALLGFSVWWIRKRIS
jgi:hypothetical protein